MKDKRNCDGCGDKTLLEDLSTCLTAFFDPDQLGVPELRTCTEDDFYCGKCLNKYAFCRQCAARISEELQAEILREKFGSR